MDNFDIIQNYPIQGSTITLPDNQVFMYIHIKILIVILSICPEWITVPFHIIPTDKSSSSLSLFSIYQPLKYGNPVNIFTFQTRSRFSRPLLLLNKKIKLKNWVETWCIYLNTTIHLQFKLHNREDVVIFNCSISVVGGWIST